VAPFLPISILVSIVIKSQSVKLILGVIVEKQAAAVAKNLDLTLKGKQPVAYKTDGDRTFPLLPFLSPL
jgi:hypothetical protein